MNKDIYRKLAAWHRELISEYDYAIRIREEDIAEYQRRKAVCERKLAEYEQILSQTEKENADE